MKKKPIEINGSRDKTILKQANVTDILFSQDQIQYIPPISIQVSTCLVRFSCLKQKLQQHVGVDTRPSSVQVPVEARHLFSKKSIY